MPEHTETAETIELSEEDRRDLEALYGVPEGATGEPPEYHTILEIWREILKPTLTETGRRISPQWATKIVQSYPEISYFEVPLVRDKIHDKLTELLETLTEEIASDPECLTYTTPEDDSRENGVHYKNLLLVWQQMFLQWELDWSPSDQSAGAEIAALSEVHRMFFGNGNLPGLTAHLDNIRFEYTEADQTLVAEALREQTAHHFGEETGE